MNSPEKKSNLQSLVGLAMMVAGTLGLLYFINLL